MYICKYFQIEELVPKDIYEESNRKDLLGLLFDKNLLYIADRLRSIYGPMVCNDGLGNGRYNYRGFRPFEYNGTSNYSQHKFGRALDLIPKNTSSGKIREDIINRKYPFMEKITAIEMNISGLHFDVRNNRGDLLKFLP